MSNESERVFEYYKAALAGIAARPAHEFQHEKYSDPDLRASEAWTLANAALHAEAGWFREGLR